MGFHDVSPQGLFRRSYLPDGDTIEHAGSDAQDRRYLLRHGNRFVLRLLENLPDPPAPLQDLAGRLVETGAETGKGLQFFELGIGDPHVAGYRSISGKLGLAAHPGHGFAHVDGGKDPLLIEPG